MTSTDLYDFLLRGGSIKCFTPQQRNAVAKFIHDEFGFPIGPGTSEYMSRTPNGEDYTLVELFNLKGSKVVSFCSDAIDPVTTFTHISHLLSLDPRIDTRTEQEFSDAFAELMS